MIGLTGPMTWYLNKKWSRQQLNNPVRRHQNRVVSSNLWLWDFRLDVNSRLARHIPRCKMTWKRYTLWQRSWSSWIGFVIVRLLWSLQVLSQRYIPYLSAIQLPKHCRKGLPGRLAVILSLRFFLIISCLLNLYCSVLFLYWVQFHPTALLSTTNYN